MDITQLINKRKSLWENHKSVEKDRNYREATADFFISDKGEEVRKAIRDNPELLIELMFVIVDKEQKTVPFFLNDVQKSFIERLNSDIGLYKAGKLIGLKYLVLKGRQQGFTSLINAYQLATAITRKNFSGYTLADNTENTESIFSDKGQFYFENLPAKLQPSIKYKNRRELDFSTETGNGLNSKWRVATAGNPDAGRSKTLSFFHGSETAFWADTHNILIGLSEAFTRGAVVVLESTAHGFNEFKVLWDGDNNYQCLFYEWWRTSEYVQYFESDEAEIEFMDNVNNAKSESDDAESKEWVYARCKSLLTRGLSWEQVYWYYIKWKDKGVTIKQEYPCTPQEAFLASGMNYFNTEVINNRIFELEGGRDVIKGYYVYEYETDIYTSEKTITKESIKWIEDNELAYVRLYNEIDVSMPYTIGADTAGDGSDHNIAQLIDNQQMQVGVLDLLVDEDLFAEQLFCFGIMHNEALIAVETNFSTYVINKLKNMGYPNLYIRENRTDAISKQIIQLYGFNTNKSTRPLILSSLKLLTKERIECFTDITTLKEMLTFIVDERGKPIAMEGEHDDTIISYAIALYAQDQQLNELYTPPDKLVGYYLDSELEDMGYNAWEIKQYKDGLSLSVKVAK